MDYSRKHIVLIGPTAPLFKGGIVHYTHCLANALADHSNVTVLSFSRSYPRILYKQKQKTVALSNKKYTELPLIDWANPFSWIRSNSTIQQLKADLLIIQWWTAFWGVPLLSLSTPGVVKVGIVHNITDHEAIPFSKQIGMTVLRSCNSLVTHASSMQRKLHNAFPDKFTLFQLHPTHTMFKAIPRLRSNHPRLLFFGHVRPYKGLSVLLDALVEVQKKIPDIHLTIVGEFWGNLFKETVHLISNRNLGSSVDVIDRYVSDSEVPHYFAASDAVVLPYTSGTGIAVSKIALATGTPIIGTHVGDMPDLFRLGKVGILVQPNNSSDLANAIVAYFKQNKELYRKEIKRVAKELTWDSFALKLLQL